MFLTARHIFVGLLLAAANVESQQAPAIVVAPERLEFPAQVFGVPSPVQTLTLSNTSLASVSLRGILVSGIDYSQNNDCGEKLEAGAKCKVSITFKPASTGDRLGALHLNWSGGGSPRTIPLTGLGQ